jgi:hypothetical protein
MTAFRLISLPLQGAFELLLGLGLAVAPVALGVPSAGAIAAVLAGTLMIGMALAKAVESASVRAQYEADWALALALVGAGAGLGLAGEPVAMLAFGLAALVQLALNLVTRYSPTTS